MSSDPKQTQGPSQRANRQKQTSRALTAFLTDTDLNEVNEDGSVISKERATAESLVYEISFENGKQVKVLRARWANTTPSAGYLVPKIEGWQEWVFDRLDGMGPYDISEKHGIPLDMLLVAFNTPGVVQELCNMLEREIYVQARMGAMQALVERMRQTEDVEIQSHALELLPVYLKIKDDRELTEQAMSPQDEEARARQVILGEET